MVLQYRRANRMNFRQYLAVFVGLSLLCGARVVVASDLQNLLISVIQTSTVAEARELLAEKPDTTGGTGHGHRPLPRVWSTHPRRQPGSFQQVRVLEGRSAFISVGRSEPEVRLLWVEQTGNGPVPNIGFSSRESRAGFFVKAELEAGEVVLQLDRYNDLSQTEYTFDKPSQAVRTTLSGRPGEWLDVGGSMELPGPVHGSRTYSVIHSDEGRFRVLVRVELVP